MIVAILGSITAIAVLCGLLFTLAIYALPALGGVAAGMWAHQTGAGLPGSVLVGLVGAVLVFGHAQFLILFARPMWLKLAVALAFMAPAAIAGFHATHGIVKHLMPSDTWQTVFAVIGAVAVGITAFVRVTSMAPLRPAGRTPASIGMPLQANPGQGLRSCAASVSKAEQCGRVARDGPTISTESSRPQIKWRYLPRNARPVPDAEWLVSALGSISGYEADWPAGPKTISISSPDMSGALRVAISSLNDPYEPTAPNGLFNGLIWPKTGCASIAYGAMMSARFLPLPAVPSFLASQETRRIAILR